MRRELLLGPLSRITNGRSLAAKMKSDGGEREEGERGTRMREREASEEKGRRRRPAAEQEALRVSEERAGWLAAAGGGETCNNRNRQKSWQNALSQLVVRTLINQARRAISTWLLIAR